MPGLVWLARDSEPLPMRLGPLSSPCLDQRGIRDLCTQNVVSLSVILRPTLLPSLLCPPSHTGSADPGLPTCPHLAPTSVQGGAPAFTWSGRAELASLAPLGGGAHHHAAHSASAQRLTHFTHFTLGLSCFMWEQVFLQILLGHW